MFKLLTFATTAAMAVTISSAAERPVFSEATLAALDPTRAGRLACRPDSDSATRERRLAMARRYIADTPAGGGTTAMPLLADIPQTQVPAGKLAGDARRYFDQGLLLAYGFNHAGAIRSFREARRLDPACVMCWWGEALANGPNINAGMDDAGNRAALAALEQAKAALPTVAPEERALIEAQLLRYSTAEGSDRAALDLAYADAMLAAATRFPANDDIAILAAEAVMNTSPWNYWTPEKTPLNDRLSRAIALVEAVIARNPAHPQASHLYIHLMEAAQPAKAEAAADRLVEQAPAILGHLVHMPSHIYYRTGRYADSMQANLLAARADEQYLALVGDDALYRYGYYPHNVHFLLTSAQMVGDMDSVMAETKRLRRILDTETARGLPWVQAIHAAPSFALAQYAAPGEILAGTQQPSDLAYVEAMRHYARAIAYAELRNDKDFAVEITAMRELEKSPAVTSMVALGFPAPDVIRLATLVAEGRQAHWRGEPMKAVALFEEAERIEATIPYNEPPIWYFPVAQSRGAALYSARRYEDARAAFRKALFEAPNDGWALYGLKMTETKLGNKAEAAAADAALKRTWTGEAGWLKMRRL
ncbi:hypothetical protein [Sphingopyxis sp. KK2]|uniref:hypothetical protein n=1 Tax=Sphingopyxis sp. KK2 TaxID=1855727 RepID=UPI00097E5B0C|nr:hypothetical protein [Sphingopyxis sp. KK2]